LKKFIFFFYAARPSSSITAIFHKQTEPNIQTIKIVE